MIGELAKLNNVYRDLFDRYGPDDSLVLQMKEAIRQRETLADAQLLSKRGELVFTPLQITPRTRLRYAVRKWRSVQ